MNQEILLKVLVAPYESDKSYRLADLHNQIVFKVATWATKKQVKAAVEKLFEVEVDAVTTANVKGKQRRTGRFIGKKKDWKKAYVRLAPGSDINFAEA